MSVPDLYEKVLDQCLDSGRGFHWNHFETTAYIGFDTFYCSWNLFTHLSKMPNNGMAVQKRQPEMPRPVLKCPNVKHLEGTLTFVPNPIKASLSHPFRRRNSNYITKTPWDQNLDTMSRLQCKAPLGSPQSGRRSLDQGGHRIQHAQSTEKKPGFFHWSFLRSGPKPN